MRYFYVILLSTAITTFIQAQCPVTTTASIAITGLSSNTAGTWSPWADNGCTDICGMCGFVQQLRICLVAGTCNGNSAQITQTACGSKPCTFPRQSCCPGFRAGVQSGQIVCLPSS